MSGADGQGAADAGAEIRVLTYNVRSLRDERDLVAQVIRSCDPDLVCIQEAPRFLRWRTKCAGLAGACGLVVLAGGATAHGNLLLGSLRTRLCLAEDVRLSPSRGLHRRGAAVAVVEIGGARLAVAGTHLGLDDRERARHVEELFVRLDRFATANLVVAGDFNEGPDRPVRQTIVQRLADAYSVAPWGGELTYPARGPVHRIDAVFVSPSIEVIQCGVPDGIAERQLVAASDHRPVLATLRVPRLQPQRPASER